MKPILFNTEMVQAILNGEKSVTRRPVKATGWKVLGAPAHVLFETKRETIGDGVCFRVSNGKTRTQKLIKPPCKPGDVLWVRETWADIPETAPGNIHYKASATDADLKWFREESWKWKPAIHMPRKLARIFLRVTDVRADRLQNMRAQDVWKEGIRTDNALRWKHEAAREDFAALWNSTLKSLGDKHLYGWDANPYVWVIDFERTEEQEDG